ncbi:MAG: NAD(P)/FAD-dependent oxidoreductase [Planctomycetota bacterium]
MTATNQFWDAIVIGGGLAGAVSATRLADAGRRVLLVESKRFPRPKVCGGCLNARAIAGLEESGLASVARDCEPGAIDRINLHNAGRSLSIPLPPGLAITRSTLDDVLLREAARRGVEVRQGVNARVAAGSGEQVRAVRLRCEGQTHTEQARVVLACDGLGHPSLADLSRFEVVVPSDSRTGLGAVLEPTAAAEAYPAGAITMAVGLRGYVGVARCEQGRVNIAAAFDRTVLRNRTSAEAVRELLVDAGLPEVDGLAAACWQASPRLSQHSPRVAGERLFLVGDAAGYVEPFTGEGMASAIEGALAVTPLALQGIDSWSDRLADDWQTAYTRRVRRRQETCRALAWMLRRPLATRIGLGAASLVPTIGRMVAAKVSA